MKRGCEARDLNILAINIIQKQHGKRIKRPWNLPNAPSLAKALGLTLADAEVPVIE
jgi:hypothetical protein